MLGQSGQGLSAVRASGGWGRISSWWTEAHALAMHGAQAVGSRVPAADDDDVPALGVDERRIGDRVPLAAPILERQEVHGEVDPAKLAARHLEIARRARPSGEQDGVELPAQIGDRYLATDVRVGCELDPFGRELLEPAVEDSLLHLELRDPVAQEPADPIVPLEDRDPMTGAPELLGRREAGGTRADHGHALVRLDHRGLGRDPALLEGMVDDRQLDRLDGHGVVIDPEHTGALAGCRAQSAGKLREVVGRVQPVDGLPPVGVIDESFQSGMRFPRGQPWWQKGMPQSMQRAACLASSVSGQGCRTWPQSLTRAEIGR